MVADLFDITEHEGRPAIILRVVAHPGAGRTAVVGQHGDALKVKVAAPPVGGRANDACGALLAELFGVAGGDVTLVSGQSSRTKRFRVDGLDAERARRLLGEAMGSAGRPERPADRPGRR